MLEPRANDITENFKETWSQVREQMDPADLTRDEVWFWWPTLMEHEPNWEALADNIAVLWQQPYLALLTIYAYGFAAALDGVMMERIFPKNIEHEGRRVPELLDKSILEDVAKRYGENH